MVSITIFLSFCISVVLERKSYLHIIINKNISDLTLPVLFRPGLRLHPQQNLLEGGGGNWKTGG